VSGADPSGLQGIVDDSPSWFGTLWNDWSWSRYFSDMGHVTLGELAALNPVHAAKGLGSTLGYLVGNGGSKKAFKHVGIGFLHSLAFWEKDDPEEFGESIMGDTLLFVPLIKRIPNFTPLALTNRIPLASGGATLLRID